MRMRADQIDKYKPFASHVQHAIPRLIHDKKILDGIKNHSGADEKTITQGVTWGQGPMIDVKPLVPHQNPDGTVSYPDAGYTAATDTIGFSLAAVGRFMQGFDMVSSSKRGSVHPVTVTLLHELTHWARAKSGTEETPGVEDGFAFETEVFGDPFGGS